MNIITSGLSALLAIFLLTGCTVEVQSSEPTASASPEDTEPRLSETDRAFITVLKNEGLDNNYTNEEIISLGTGTCDLIDTSGSVLAAAEHLIDVSGDAEVAGFLLGASIMAYCPEYEDEMDAIIEGSETV